MIPYEPAKYLLTIPDFGLGAIPIPVWLFFNTVATLTAVYISYRVAKSKKWDIDEWLFITVLMLLSGILGLRVFHFAFKVDSANLLYDIFNPWSSGMSSVGTFMSIPVIYIYMRFKNISFGKYVDTIAPSLGLFIFIARFGCLTRGCCFGKLTTVPWGLQYVGSEIVRHPAPVYSMIHGLLILYIINHIKKKRFDGYLFGIFVLLYSAGRFIIEFFRVNPYYILGLSPVQIFLIIVSTITIILLYKQARLQTQSA